MGAPHSRETGSEHPIRIRQHLNASTGNLNGSNPRGMGGVVARGERGAYDGIRPEYDRYGARPLFRDAIRS